VTFGPNIDLSVENYSQAVNQREPTIAVNPRNSMNFVEGNIDHLPTASDENCSFSFTLDGGRTWSLGGIVPLEASSDFTADPAMAADADGNFYYSYLDTSAPSNPPGAPQTTDLVVAKSTDGGRTFPSFSVAVHGSSALTSPFFPDKEYIGVDTSAGSPFKGTIYAAFTNAGPNGYQIMVTVSRDQATTWLDPIGISPITSFSTEGLFGALPVIGPDGTVYIFYADFLFNTGPTSIKVSKSADGGRTWSRPANVAAGLPSPGFFRLKNSDPNWDTTAFLGIDANSEPIAAIAPDGTLFVAWVDFPHGSCVNDGTGFVPCTNSDVRLVVSRNGGMSWSRPVKVSDETNATDQFFPWIAVHPNGLLSLSWQDKRLDPNNVNYDNFYTNTFDGVTFLPNVRVTTQTSLSGNQQSAIFDYDGMAVTADSIIPVWTDMRSGNPDVFTAVGHFVP